MSDKKKLLIVINAENYNLKKKISNSNEYFYINLTNNQKINLNNINFKEINYGDILDNIYIEKYNFFENNFSINIKKNDDLINSRLFDFNFSDEIWKKYVTIKIIDYISKKFDIDEIIFLKNDIDIIAFFRNRYFKEISNFNKSRLTFIKNIKITSYYIALYIHNFFNKFLLSFVMLFYNNKKTNNVKEVVFCSFPNNWIMTNVLNYRYTGSHFNRVNKYNLNNESLYFVSLLRNNQDKINNIFVTISSLLKIYKNKQIIIAENYYGLIEIIKVYLYSLIFFFSKINKFKILNKELTIFNWEIFLRHALIENPKNQLINFQIKNFIKKNNKIVNILIPMYELYEQRMIINSLKIEKTNFFNIFGIQQGAIGIGHLWRFVYSQSLFFKYNNLYTPDKYFLEGISVKNLYQKYGINNSFIIGALRIFSLPKVYSYNKNFNRVFIILLDMHNWKNNLNEFLEKLSKHDNYLTFIKPHPSRFNFVKKYLTNNKHFNKKFIITNENITELINKNYNFIILANETGAVIELAKKGWPCFLIKNKNSLSYSPLAIDNTSIYKNFNDIDLIIGLSEYELCKYSNKLIQISEKYFSEYGEKATDNLINVMKKYE